jgi:flagellar hook-basal body complex protein FliE
MNIAPIRPPAPIELHGPTGVERPARDPLDLGESFGKALQDAHGAEQRSTAAAEQFARGDSGMGIHEVMIATEKANLAVRYVTTLKNKALEAYRELMNTQV